MLYPIYNVVIIPLLKYYLYLIFYNHKSLTIRRLQLAKPNRLKSQKK